MVGFLSKPFSVAGHFADQNKCTSLTRALRPGVLHLSSDSSGERGRDVDLQMQTRWLDCFHIAFQCDHNASSTASGPGHADRTRFRLEAHLHVFSMCM